MKLLITEYHQENEQASKYVLKLCKALNLAVSASDLKRIIEVKIGDKIIPINFAEEVEHARKEGVAKSLQSMLDSGDRILNSPPSIGTTSMSIGLSSSYGSHSTTIKGPGHIEAPEISFSTDIIYYRKEAVAMFNSGNLVEFCRCYRAYLQSCISLVDCFIHRYNFHIKMVVPDTSAYMNLEVIDSRQSIEKRLEALMQAFACHKLADLKASKYWLKFMGLKTQRNNIVHPSSPTIPYSVADAVKYLNDAQDGVGGFLAEMRKSFKHTEHIGFISRIKTAPEISIQKIKLLKNLQSR